MSGWDKVGWSWMYDGMGNRKRRGNWPEPKYRKFEAKDWKRENPGFRRGVADIEPEDPTCPVCGKPADCRTLIDGVLFYHHEHEPGTAPDMEAACRQKRGVR